MVGLWSFSRTRYFSPIIFLFAAACSSDLSRGEALKAVQDQLAGDHWTVSELRVEDGDVALLIDHGEVAAGQPTRCLLTDCSPLHASPSSRLFSEVTGHFSNRGDSEAHLTLRTPLHPTDIQITGITQYPQYNTASVEFSYRYQVPAELSQLKVKPVGDYHDFLSLKQGKWTFTKYDDGWRVTDVN